MALEFIWPSHYNTAQDQSVASCGDVVDCLKFYQFHATIAPSSRFFIWHFIAIWEYVISLLAESVENFLSLQL